MDFVWIKVSPAEVSLPLSLSSFIPNHGSSDHISDMLSRRCRTKRAATLPKRSPDNHILRARKAYDDATQTARPVSGTRSRLQRRRRKPTSIQLHSSSYCGDLCRDVVVVLATFLFIHAPGWNVDKDINFCCVKVRLKYLLGNADWWERYKAKTVAQCKSV